MRQMTDRVMTRPLPLLATTLALTLAALAPAPAPAQSANPFAPVILVNDLGITGYEIDQRMKFMTLLRQPGDLRKEAEKGLIEDRLRIGEAKRMGITLNKEGLAQGMAEFASRANLSTEQFLAELAKGGVEAQTFRDFVEAGMLWREVVKQKYAQKVRVSDADIDRALLLETQARGQGTRVLISEIIVPAPPGREAEAMAAAKRASAASGDGSFGALAREISAAPSAERGGRLDWMDLDNLPPQLRPVILGLKPGQASAPLAIPNAVAVFMLRGIDDKGNVKNTPQQLDYARFIAGPAGAPETSALIATLKAGADRCDDLYGLAKGLPAERLLRESGAQGALPADLSLALGAMDIGESTVLQRGGNAELVMLCARSALPAEGTEAAKPDRNQVAQNLTNQALNAYADADLADLMAQAVITRK